MGTSFASEVLAIVGEETASRMLANRRSSKACFVAEIEVALPGGFLDDGLVEVMLSRAYAHLHGQHDDGGFC